MATGRVLQFDQIRGYGFVAADDGGEDIFLHASVFDGDADELAPGMRLQFQVMEGDRGRKAFAAQLLAGTAPEAGPIRPAPAAPRPLLAAPVSPAEPPRAAEDEQLCDVLSHAEFEQELTELLLSNTPALAGQQILEVRQGMLDLAKKHGWIDI